MKRLMTNGWAMKWVWEWNIILTAYSMSEPTSEWNIILTAYRMSEPTSEWNND